MADKSRIGVPKACRSAPSCLWRQHQRVYYMVVCSLPVPLVFRWCCFSCICCFDFGLCFDVLLALSLVVESIFVSFFISFFLLFLFLYFCVLLFSFPFLFKKQQQPKNKQTKQQQQQKTSGVPLASGERHLLVAAPFDQIFPSRMK